VPLFIAKSTDQEGVYLTTRQNDREVIPVYFSREDVQGMIDRLRQSQPDLANKVEIQVINLEGLIQNLQTSDNEALNQIVLVPSQETRTFIRSLAPAEGQPAQGQQNPNRNRNRNRPNPAPQAQPSPAPARPQQ
jgi:Tic22-like family